MKVKTQKSALPGAWIVNPIDKGRKSIKSNNNIYLENDTSFEIELFNPLTDNILADIRLNGKSISKTGLIVKPGQRIYLDCFIDDKKKFIFQTYEVENSIESKQAIKNNGVLEVFFYKEQAISIQNWPNRFHQTVIREYYPVYYPTYPRYYDYPWYSTGINWYSGGTVTTTGGNSTLTIDGNINLSSSISSGTSYSSSIGPNAFYSNVSNTSSFGEGIQQKSLSDKIETGRVEKGEKSDQKFEEVDMEFEKNYIHHLVYNLLPTSQKPIEASELEKKFCSECGSKIKDKFKFCPACGEKI